VGPGSAIRYGSAGSGSPLRTVGDEGEAFWPLVPTATGSVLTTGIPPIFTQLEIVNHLWHFLPNGRWDRTSMIGPCESVAEKGRAQRQSAYITECLRLLIGFLVSRPNIASWVPHKVSTLRIPGMNIMSYREESLFCRRRETTDSIPQG
jgi:hypothetical protein